MLKKTAAFISLWCADERNFCSEHETAFDWLKVDSFFSLNFCTRDSYLSRPDVTSLYLSF